MPVFIGALLGPAGSCRKCDSELRGDMMERGEQANKGNVWLSLHHSHGRWDEEKVTLSKLMHHFEPAAAG